MTEHQLENGIRIGSQIKLLQTRKEHWERAKRTNQFLLIDEKGDRITENYNAVYYDLTEDEFQMVKFMRLRRLEAEIAALEVELENI